MLVRRWRAQMMPNPDQIKLIFLQEDLRPKLEVYDSGVEILEHRHPFDEIRMVASGELFINVSGNQLLLRPGDRIEIPSNTRHSTVNKKDSKCVCVVANQVFRS